MYTNEKIMKSIKIKNGKKQKVWTNKTMKTMIKSYFKDGVWVYVRGLVYVYGHTFVGLGIRSG